MVYDVETARAALKKLAKNPPEKQVSRRKVIDSLSGDIKKLLKNGYGLKEIAAVLQESGLDVKPQTISAYMSRQRTESADGKSQSKTPSPRRKKQHTEPAPATVELPLTPTPADPTAKSATTKSGEINLMPDDV